MNEISSCNDLKASWYRIYNLMWNSHNLTSFVFCTVMTWNVWVWHVHVDSRQRSDRFIYIQLVNYSIDFEVSPIKGFLKVYLHFCKTIFCALRVNVEWFYLRSTLTPFSLSQCRGSATFLLLAWSSVIIYKGSANLVKKHFRIDTGKSQYTSSLILNSFVLYSESAARANPVVGGSSDAGVKSALWG